MQVLYAKGTMRVSAVQTPQKKTAARSAASARDVVEAKLKRIFGERLIPVEKASSIISRFKGDNFAMSQVGMMLYCNGYSLRGTSHQYLNGLVYCDGQNIFGVGYFAKEGEEKGHLMLVAPHGPQRFATALRFLKTAREQGISESSAYIRHLSLDDYWAFSQLGLWPIEANPWHPEAHSEDEHYCHRLIILDDWFGFDTERDEPTLHDLPYSDSRAYRKKARQAYNRFKNFLQRNNMVFELDFYHYSEIEKRTARGIVENYFASRRRRGGAVGSTPEDYLAIVNQKPDGQNGTDYFAYLGYLRSTTANLQKQYPVAFFVGERLGGVRAGLYATLSARFEEDAKRLPLRDTTGYTALAQFVYLTVFGEMYKARVREIDIGGSETAGLDYQKKQLGGRPHKTYWVVAP